MTRKSRVQSVSIVVVTFNRGEILRQALESLSQLHVPVGLPCEIIVIDNGSRDQTPEIIAQCAERSTIPIRGVHESQAGIPFARNRGVREAANEWIAFTDDDQLTDPNWLKLLIDSTDEHGVDCVGGSRSLQLDQPPAEPLHVGNRILLGEIADAQAGFYHEYFLPCTGNVLVRKSLIEQLGGFDEAVLDGGEDSDFFNRLIRAGHRAYYTPQAAVIHLIGSNRLKADYLGWIAYRHGRHLCRRDLKFRGLLTAVALSSMRLGHVLLVAMPRWGWATITGKRSDRVSHWCAMRKTSGYTSYLLANLTGKLTDHAAWTHRGKG